MVADLIHRDIDTELVLLSAQSGVPHSRYIRVPAPPPPKERAGVCFLTTELHVGGAETWLGDLIALTADAVHWNGVGVSRFCHETTRKRIEEFCPVSERQGVRELVAASAAVLTWQIDARQWPVNGARVIAVCHCPQEDDAVKKFYGPLIPSAPEWVSVCASSAEQLRVLGADVQHIENGVDFSRLGIRTPRREQRARWGIAGEKVVACIGRLSDEKRHELIWQSLPILGPEWRAVYLCAPHVNAEMVQAIKSRPGVSWAGHVPTDEVASYIAAVDVVAHVSRWESYCYAIAEAWALGIPVAATRHGLAARHPFAAIIDEPITPHEVASAVRRAASIPRRTLDAARKAITDEAVTFSESWSNLLFEAAQPARVKLLDADLYGA